MAAAWLPGRCIDEELSAEFDRAGDGPAGRWQFWSDENRTVELSLEEVGRLADTPDQFFYTTANWHFHHCLFLWRKQQRAKVTGVLVERRYDNERHVKHCGKVFSKPLPVYAYVELKSSAEEPHDFSKITIHSS
ncbi:hypothetical protein O9K51_10800 [Purpureocillium lavendulum]|uniref:Uncharacterized protein n=1 Tax=Purpureocillium lavendulum TaxID=1247861 RepID=A0AB34FCY2_9HYPO|nr:hypothetical protein O9K51_10800 [Purpureocillium lavendulum]